MRALAVVAALAAALLWPGGAPAQAAITAPFSAVEQRPVAPGVTYRRGNVTGAAGPASVNVVSTQLSESIALYTTLAQDRINAREAPTSQAARHSREGHRIVATINGSNFSAPEGQPYQANGLLMSGGEITAAGFRRGDDAMPAFGIDASGNAIAGAPRIAITATLPDGSQASIARVNQRVDTDDSTLFTPRYDTSTRTQAPEIEVTLSGVELPLRPSGSYTGTVSDVRLGVGDSPLAENTLVIAANGATAAALAPLQVGDMLTIDVVLDQPWQNIVVAVGGREVLIKDGAIDIFPTNGRQYKSSEPRSALGVTASGEILMVTVDGRQPHTRGLSVPEMAQLMLDMGAVHAINLDGGGSTVLSARTPGNVEATIVNSPSGGVERTVSNAVHVVSAIPTGPLAEVVLLPARAQVKEGETRQLRFGGFDAAYNGIDPDLGPISWTSSSPTAAVDANGLLTGLAVGPTTVQAVAGGWSASAEVQVVPDLGVLTVTPPEVTLMPERAAGKKGMPLSVTWTAGNPKFDVTRIELQARANGGAWSNVALPAGVPAGAWRSFKFGPLHQLRIRATDAAGNRTAWVLGTPFRLVAYNVTHPTIERLGQWKTIRTSSAIGGALARSGLIGSSLGLTVVADQVAVIGQRSARGGVAEIGFAEGTSAATTMAASATTSRLVLWVGQPSETDSGPSSIRISNASTGKPSRVEIDEVVVLLLGG